MPESAYNLENILENKYNYLIYNYILMEIAALDCAGDDFSPSRATQCYNVKIFRSQSRGQPPDAEGAVRVPEWWRVSVLKSHKYSLGQTVRYTAGPLNRGASGTFKIVRLMPPDGDEHQYRIKSTEEAFERVAKESQLDRYR